MNLFSIKKITPPYRSYLSILDKHFGRLRRDAIASADISSRRKSDTLFILGSGASINTYAESKWHEISRHDTFGFNMWLYHELVPTYYMDECIKPAGAPFLKLAVELQRHRLHDYRNTLVILKDYRRLLEYPELLDDYPFAHLPHFFFPYSREIKGETPRQHMRQLQILSLQGAFRRKKSLWYWLTKRGSVYSIVVFGIIAGYRRIVLCGIDLNNPYYFYRAEKYRKGPLPQLPDPASDPDFARQFAHYYLMPDAPPPAGIDVLPSVHPSHRPQAGTLTMLEALRCLRDVVARPRKIEIYSALQSSALYPEFPSFFE